MIKNLSANNKMNERPFDVHSIVIIIILMLVIQLIIDQFFLA